ncbi:MAG: peptidoglycan-binding domain-containing protein [Faecalibacterium prausnitzii]
MVRCAEGRDGKSLGASTQRAVQEFQLKNKMNMDGKVGQNTWNVLYTRYTAKHGPKVPLPRHRAAHRLLRRHGAAGAAEAQLSGRAAEG